MKEEDVKKQDSKVVYKPVAKNSSVGPVLTIKSDILVELE